MEGKEEKRARMEGIKGEVDMTFLLLQPQAGSHCLLDPWLSQCVSRPGCALRLSLGLVRIPGSTLTGAWLRIFTNIASPPPTYRHHHTPGADFLGDNYRIKDINSFSTHYSQSHYSELGKHGVHLESCQVCGCAQAAAHAPLPSFILCETP